MYIIAIEFCFKTQPSTRTFHNLSRTWMLTNLRVLRIITSELARKDSVTYLQFT